MEDWYPNFHDVPCGQELADVCSPLKLSEKKLEKMSPEYSKSTSSEAVFPVTKLAAVSERNSLSRKYNRAAAELSNSSLVSISDFVRKLTRCDLSQVQVQVDAVEDLKEGHRKSGAIDAIVSWKEFEETLLTDVTRGTAPLHVHCRSVHQFDTIGDVAHEYDTSRAGEEARNTKVEKCRHKLLELAEKHLDDRTVPSLEGLAEANGTPAPRIRDVDAHCLVDPAERTEINFGIHRFRPTPTIKYYSERRAVSNADLRYLDSDSGLLNRFQHKSSSANDMLVAAGFVESNSPLIPSGAANESNTCRLRSCVSPDDGSATIPLKAERSTTAARLKAVAGSVDEGQGSRYGWRGKGGKKGLICLTLREMTLEVPGDVCNNPHQILAYLKRDFSKRESNTEIAGNILILESPRHHRDGSSQTRLYPNSGKCDCDIVSSAVSKGFPVHTIPCRQKIEYVMHETRTIRHPPEELSPLPLPESVPIKSRVDTRETPAESQLSDETWESSKQSFLSPAEVAPFHDQKQTIHAFIRHHLDTIDAPERHFSLPPNFKQFEYVPDKPRSTVDVAVQTDLESGVLEVKHDKLSNDTWIAIRSKRSLDALNLIQSSGKRFAGSKTTTDKSHMSFVDGQEETLQDENEYAYSSPRERDCRCSCIDQVVPSSDKAGAECLVDLNEEDAEADAGRGKGMGSTEVPGRMFDSLEEEAQLVGTSTQVITCGERKGAGGAPVAAACGDIGAENVCEIFDNGDRDGIDPPNQQARSLFQWYEEKLLRSESCFPKASKRLPARLRLGLSKRARPPPLHPIRYSQNPIKSKNIPRS